MNTENKANIEEKIEESVERARQMMREGTDKLVEMSKREEVQQAKTKFLEELANIKSWCFSNWNAGRYGKFRVIAVAVVVALAVKGLFFGWGESENLKIAKMQKEAAEMEAGAAVWGALLGGGGASQSSSSHSSGPQKKTWMCAQCGNQVQAMVPPSSVRCRAYHGQRDGSCKEKCNWREVR